MTDEKTPDKYSEMLREQTGFYDSKAISWKLVAIPLIKKAEEKAKSDTLAHLSEEIEKLTPYFKGGRWVLREEVLAIIKAEQNQGGK